MNGLYKVASQKFGEIAIEVYNVIFLF